MGGVADFVEDTVGGAFDLVGDTVDFVGDALEDTWEVVADAADWVVDTAGSVVQGALDDPIKTIAQVAAVASGNAYLLPYISAADTAMAGGDIKDIAKSAAVSYAAGQIAQGVAGDVGITVDDAGIPLLPSDVAAMSSGAAGAAGSQLAGNVAGGAAGNAFASAVMGGDLDQILNASIVGGLGAGTNTALKELGVPKDLVPVAGGAVAGGAGALLNGGDVYQSVLRGAAIGGVNSALNVTGRELQTLYKQNKESLAEYLKNTEEYKPAAKEANDFLESTYKPVAEQTQAKYNDLISLNDQFDGERSAYDNLMSQFEENKQLYNETKDPKYAEAANALVDEIEAAAEKANATYAQYEKLLPEYQKIKTQAETLAAQYTTKYEKAIELDTAAKQALESYETTYGEYVGKAVDFNKEFTNFTGELTKSFVQNTGEVPTVDALNKYITSGKDINEIVGEIQQSDLGVQWSDIKGQEQELRSLFENDLVQRVSKGYGMPYVTEGDEGTPAQLQRWGQYEQKLNEALQNNDKDAAVQATFNYYKDLAENGNPLFRINEDGSVDSLVEGVRMYAEPIGIDENDFPIYYEKRDDIQPELASDNALRNLFNFANNEDVYSDSWLSSWLGQGGVGDMGSATPMGIVSGPGGLFQTPNGEAFSLIEVGGKKYMQDPDNPLSVYEVTPEIQTAIDTAEYIKTNDVNKDGQVNLTDAIQQNNQTGTIVQEAISGLGSTLTSQNEALNEAIKTGDAALIKAVEGGNQDVIEALNSGNTSLATSIAAGAESTTGAISELGTTLTGQNTALNEAIKTGNESVVTAVNNGNQGVIDALNSGNTSLATSIANSANQTSGALGELGSTLTNQNTALNEAIKTGDQSIVDAVKGGNQGVIDALGSGNTTLAAAIAAGTLATTTGLSTLGNAFGGLRSTLTANNAVAAGAPKDLGAGVVTGQQAELGNLNTFQNIQAPQQTAAQQKPDDIYFDESDIQRAAEGGQIEHSPQFFSEGGLGTLDNRYVKGDGDGTSDSVPAMLASGEFVIPADVVSGLGNGDNDAGASVLDEFMKAIRMHKRAADPSELPEDSKGPLAYLQEAMTKVRK